MTPQTLLKIIEYNKELFYNYIPVWKLNLKKSSQWKQDLLSKGICDIDNS